jgi:hypothetical protein
MAVEISESLEQFFAEPIPAVVGTLRKNGSIQMNPIWYEYRDGQIWLNSWRGSDWARHIEEQGTATLLIIDPANVHRNAQIQVKFLESTDEGGREHIEHLSQRYTGGPYRRTTQQRFILKMEPTVVQSQM